MSNLKNRGGTSSVSSAMRPSQRLHCTPVSAETLESRLLLSTVNAWKSPVSGDWDTAANWSLGHIPKASEDVNITVAGSYGVTHMAGADAAHSITLSHPLTLSGGTLSVGTTVTANSMFTLSGGILVNATLSAGAGGQFVFHGATLNHVTLGSDLSFANADQATVTKGLKLNGHKITFASAGSYTGITFSDPAAQTLAGPGQIVLAGPSSSTNFLNCYGTASSPLTFAANVTFSGTGGLIQGLGGPDGSLLIQSQIAISGAGGSCTISNFTNQGTMSVAAAGTLVLSGFVNPSGKSISANAGGTLSLAGAWSNQGTIASTNATVNLGGTFTKLGTFNRIGGAVNLTGTYTVNGTLAFTATTGSWNLMNGTVVNATLTSANGANLLFTSSSGTLNHVTLGTDLTFQNGQQIYVVKGLMLNGHTITFNGVTGYTGITFSDTAAQTLAGPGQLVFAGTNPSVDFLNSYGGATNPLTLGAGVMMSGKGCLIQGLSGAPSGLINAATITATGGNLSISNFTNRGTLMASGGDITVSAASLSNTGTINVSTGHTIFAPATLTNSGAGVLSGTGTISSANVVNSAVVSPGSASTGTLTLTGVFKQTSGGSIREELGGNAAGQSDKLVVKGVATLAGLLDVYLVNGFHPASGKVFTAITYASQTGVLNTAGLNVGNGIVLKAAAGATSLTLTAGPLPVDTQRPTVSAPTVVGTPKAGVKTIEFKVTYTDDSAIDFTTIGNGDVLVTGPNAFSKLATFVSSSKTNNGTPNTVIYQITLTTGTFKAGSYKVAVQAAAVKDTHGNAVLTGAGGAFVLPAA